MKGVDSRSGADFEKDYRHSKTISVALFGATSLAKEKPMADKIKTGSILIEEVALLPESLRFESEPYSEGWRIVKNLDGYGLERRISEAGWTFFYMAGEIKASVFGFDGEKTRRRAIQRILAKLKSDRFNCLEITQVAAERFLGLPYVSVSAHWRHIQESLVLFHAKRVAEWDRGKMAAAGAQK